MQLPEISRDSEGRFPGERAAPTGSGRVNRTTGSRAGARQGGRWGAFASSRRLALRTYPAPLDKSIPLIPFSIRRDDSTTGEAPYGGVSDLASKLSETFVEQWCCHAGIVDGTETPDPWHVRTCQSNQVVAGVPAVPMM